MSRSRRAFLTAATALYTVTGILRYPGGAAEFVYKFHCDGADATPLTKRSLQAASNILRESNGRLELQVYPNMVLGGDEAVIPQVRLGAVEMAIMGPNLSTGIPSIGLLALPFVFSSPDEAWRACDGPLSPYLDGEFSKLGLYRFRRVWDASFNEISNNVRPINTPDDLRGLKLRCGPQPVVISLLRAMGASPTPLDNREVYTALQSHLVDGTVSPWFSIVASKYYELLKYASAVNQNWIAESVFANMTAWRRLPANLRDIVERNLDAAALRERNDMKTGDAAFVAQIKERGVAYNAPDVRPFREAVRKAGLYTQWRATFADAGWKALEKSVGQLA